MTRTSISLLANALLLAACSGPSKQEKQAAAIATPPQTVTTPAAETVRLPAPYATESATKRSNVVGWPAGKMPIAPAGFTVAEYASKMDSPRWMYVAPNGDVLVAESTTIPTSTKLKVAAALNLDKSRSLRAESANRVTLFRDTNKDGKPDLKTTFLTGVIQNYAGTL